MSDDARAAKAEAKAAKARAKAMRPWYTKKRIIIPGILALVVVIAVASGGGDTDSGGSTDLGAENAAAETQLFPGRVDAQPKDQEREIGQAASIDGVNGGVAAAGFQQSVSDFEDAGYIVADVQLINSSDKAQAYNYFNWRVQTPGGQVLDAAFVSTDTLGSGDLVQGGTVSGKVVFEVGSGKGDFYIIWKPNPIDASRGIWKVTI